MRRVALVCEPPDGGTAEHVLQLALGLPDHGYEAVVFAPPTFGRAGRLADCGVEVQTLPLSRDYRHPRGELTAATRLGGALRGGDFAIVHCHAAKAGVLGRIAARFAGVPAVYTPHGFPFTGEVSRRRRVFSLPIERMLGHWTAAIVCVCEQERHVASAAGLPAERLVVVHNGCPTCDGGPVDSTLTELKAQGQLVAALTVLRPKKGLDVLLAAAPRLLAEVDEARIAIVGNGPDEPFLLALAKQAGLLHDPRFAFVPYVGPASRHLRALDVYVLPSINEALPIGLLEAQACGVPQVATAVGGNGEVVTSETGVLVPPRDPVRLAEALATLLRDPARRLKMAAASKARHAELFTADRMVTGTAAVYESVLAGR